MGYTLYGFDVYTDVLFAMDMFHKIDHNVSDAIFSNCSSTYTNLVARQADLVKNLCLKEEFSFKCVSELKKIGDQGFNTENRFQEDFNIIEWLLTCLTSYIHVALPMLFTMFLSLLVIAKKLDIGTYVPVLPIFTKLYATILDWQLFKMYMTDPKVRSTPWNQKKEDLIDKKDTNERVINLSMINEAALESSFQVSKNYLCFIACIA